MKFKEGDKVLVRSDLDVDQYYGREYFHDSMRKWKGKIITIDRIIYSWYDIKEDDEDCWTEEMFVLPDPNDMTEDPNG